MKPSIPLFRFSACVFLSGAALAQPTGPFTASGPMTTSRANHAATLLQGRRVLITGGDSYAAAIPGVPAAAPLVVAQSPGTFTAIADMTTPRWVHTATLLPDGQVLIAGGENASSPLLSSTEIYDPATQTFTPSGNMTMARSGHTATLLADGRVLIVGGDSIGSAEIYDPSTGSFTATGSLLMPRNGPNATLLEDGRVLVTGGTAGGFTPSGYLPIGDAEVYDPSPGVFTSGGAYAGVLANNTVPSDGFGATSTLLPDGTVMFGTEPAAQVYDPSIRAFALRGRSPLPIGGGTRWPRLISWGNRQTCF